MDWNKFKGGWKTYLSGMLAMGYGGWQMYNGQMSQDEAVAFIAAGLAVIGFRHRLG